MKAHPIVSTLATVGAVAAGLMTLPARAADPDETSKNIIAVQIRKQGFACPKALKAERGTNYGDPDDGVWVLTCDVATYKVRLIPNMAASVEPLANDNKGTQSP